MPAGYPKVAYPLEISSWIRNLFTHGQTLLGRFAIDSEAIDRRVDVVYRDVITGSRESRDHHYDARLIHRILKSLLPQNNTFFIATASVVKDAADNPDCQGLREQWYYLWFYMRRTMPPTEWAVSQAATLSSRSVNRTENTNGLLTNGLMKPVVLTICKLCFSGTDHSKFYSDM